MNDADKVNLMSELNAIGARLTAATAKMTALPSVLPPAIPNTPVTLATLTGPLTSGLQDQGRAIQDLIKLIEKVLKDE